MSARNALAACLALALAVALAACSSPAQPSQQVTTATTSVQPTVSVPATAAAAVETTIVTDGKKDVVATVKASSGFSTMSELLDAAGLSKPLATGKGPYTLFVPTNEAFAKLPADWLPKLKEPANIEKLRRLLRYHLVKDRIASQQMFTIRRLMTYEGGVLKITTKSSVGYINGTVKITQGDVPAKNGLIHVVDTVLVPPGFKP